MLATVNPMKTKIFKFILPLLVLKSLLFGCATAKSRNYDIKEMTIGSDFQVKLNKYAADTSTKKALIILPPTGGTNFIDRSYARRFSNEGYDVYLVEEWSGMNEQSTDLELHQRLYSGAQRAVSLVINEIKSPYIGLLGTSVGALHGAVSAGMQDRLNSVFIITGGAPIAEIIITSDQKAMQELKKARQQRYGFKNDTEYRAALDKAFTLEPLAMSQHTNKALGMAIATEDETVPTKTQNQLQAFWKPQKVISYSSDHFWGIIKTWWSTEGEIVEFFEKNAR